MNKLISLENVYSRIIDAGETGFNKDNYEPEEKGNVVLQIDHPICRDESPDNTFILRRDGSPDNTT